MTKIKKIIVCVLTLCIVSAAFCGCKDDTSKETTTESSTTSADTSEKESESDSKSENVEISMIPEDEKSDNTERGDFTTEIEDLKPDETVPVITKPKPNPIDLKGYVKENPDTKGWLRIPGTSVNYPVMQAADNSYYLHRNAYKQDSFAGSLYCDYRNVLTGSNASDNLVVYGHNMANGSYFGSLNNYKYLSFYKRNAIVQFNTTEANSTYVIVAVFYTNTHPESDNGNEWKYYKEHNFNSQTAFNTWKNNVSKRSFYTTTIDYKKSDKFLTLSTCSNVAGNNGDGRLVVVARKTRANEKIDTNGISKNPNIYLPAAWNEKATLATLK